MSRAECEALFQRIVGMTTGGGDTVVNIRLAAKEYLNWARNSPTMAGADRGQRVIIERMRGTSRAKIETTKMDDASLKAAIARAEGRLSQGGGTGRSAIILPEAQQYLTPPLWSDATFALTDEARSEAGHRGAMIARAEQMLAAGHVETRAVTWAIFNTRGLAAYAGGTGAQYSETVRDAAGTASGWAGLQQTDWAKLNVEQLAARALQKCKDSLKAQAVEPGRYTVILEPQAVGSFMAHAINEMNLEPALQGGHAYSGKAQGTTKIGQKILDERITITTDPMDPDAPYIPFDAGGEAFRPTTWVEHGVLKALAYSRSYAQKALGGGPALLNPTAFRMSGGPATIEEMVASTQRGLLITRFGLVALEDERSLQVSTVTRDGLWLIEKGKITRAVKNMRVLESPLFVGTSVLDLGKPERIFSSYWRNAQSSFAGANWDNFTPQAFGNIPIVVPPMKVRDFNFVALADAV